MALAPKFHNLALVGFMGSGKSSVGRSVASCLGYDYLDTDEWIEARAGKPIAEIFEADGEPAFRRMESEMLDELGGVRRKVIATGGGLVTHAGNMDRLKALALVFCLWASPDTIWQRVRNQKHRPLLNGTHPQKTIQDLLIQREPHYRQADVLVTTDRRSVRQVTQQIIHQYRIELGEASSELDLGF